MKNKNKNKAFVRPIALQTEVMDRFWGNLIKNN